MRAAAEMMMVIGRAGIPVVVMPLRSIVMIRLAAGLGGMMADVNAADVRSQKPGTQPGHHAENHQSCEKVPHQRAENRCGLVETQGKIRGPGALGFGLA